MLVGWNFISSALSTGANALVAESNLLRKVYFPREAPVLGAIGSSYADLLVALALAVPLVAILGGDPFGLPLLTLPLVLVLLGLPAAALALGLSAVNVYFRDVRYALPAFIQFFLFASPVAFPSPRSRLTSGSSTPSRTPSWVPWTRSGACSP